MKRLTPFLDSDVLLVGLLVLIMAEALTLLVWQRRQPASGSGPQSTVRIVSFLGAGASLVIAMIFHRRDEPSPELFALAMLSALVFHLWHISVLFRR